MKFEKVMRTQGRCRGVSGGLKGSQGRSSSLQGVSETFYCVLWALNGVSGDSRGWDTPNDPLVFQQISEAFQDGSRGFQGVPRTCL